MGKIYYKVAVALLFVIAVVTFILLVSEDTFVITEIEEIDRSGKIPPVIHWHPRVAVFINGNESVVPAGIGIYEDSEALIHTHDESGVLHMEQTYPEEETLKLGYFFHAVWNKTLNASCIFEYCTNATHELKMWVNSRRDYSFDNLTMRDADIILIVYSKSYSIIAQF